jgi:hypothetical protein
MPAFDAWRGEAGTAVVFDGRTPRRWQAKVGGHPPTQVEEEPAA